MIPSKLTKTVSDIEWSGYENPAFSLKFYELAQLLSGLREEEKIRPSGAHAMARYYQDSIDRFARTALQPQGFLRFVFNDAFTSAHGVKGFELRRRGGSDKDASLYVVYPPGNDMTALSSDESATLAIAETLADWGLEQVERQAKQGDSVAEHFLKQRDMAALARDGSLVFNSSAKPDVRWDVMKGYPSPLPLRQGTDFDTAMRVAEANGVQTSIVFYAGESADSSHWCELSRLAVRKPAAEFVALSDSDAKAAGRGKKPGV